MKKLSSIFASLLLSAALMAQVPQKMTYQSIIRNASDQLITNQTVGMRISILQGSNVGASVYTETLTPGTNSNGLATVEIGSNPSFSTIDWAAGPYFIKIEVDPAGGTNYTISGATELLSVPYALYSANGTPGPAGADGADGTDGVDGVGIVSTFDNGNGTFTLNYSDATSFTTSNLTGPTGATGPAGPVAGSDKQIIFNNTGIAAGSANLTWNNSTTTLGVTGGVNSTYATVTSLGGSGTRFVTADNAGLISAVAFPGITGTGNNTFLTKWTTAGSVIGNSLIQDNGTSIGINNAPINIYQAYVYRQQLTANGDGQTTLLGYRTRDDQNDGTAYSFIGSNSATSGYNFWGDMYTFGVAGFCYNDYSRTGGVLGADVNGSSWGSLGYRSSGLVNYGVYGSSAYATGTGKLQSSGSAGIGGGFYGDFIGSTSQGSVVGQLNSGELFAQYNIGNIYTLGKNVELVKTNDKIVPVYSVTSLEANIYEKGTATLQNGTATIVFPEEYIILLKENPVITVSPNGECNGLYIASVSSNGFTVKELSQGSSNVTFSWIAVGTRIDEKMEAATKMVSDPSFDRNMRQVLYSDGNLEGSAMGIYWDGSSIRFGQIPADLSPAPKKEIK